MKIRWNLASRQLIELNESGGRTMQMLPGRAHQIYPCHSEEPDGLSCEAFRIFAARPKLECSAHEVKGEVKIPTFGVQESKIL
jgi:hypothetical protein